MRRLPAIRDEILRQRAMLKGGMPQIDIGPHCGKPYGCDFKGHCWAHIPEESVFEFADKGAPDPFKLYRQGILQMKDTPTDILGWRQKMQLECHLQQSSIVDKEAVQEFLDGLWYPLAFLDFETTCFTPIPLFDNTRPYQQVPFQFSLHIQDEPGAELRHIEFLAPPEGAPQESFLDALLEAVPAHACVLSWNAAFEKRIMRELGNGFPHRQAELHKVIDNLVDLMGPFLKKQVYHWEFRGSYSIKAVLPALVPELTYGELEIADGATAAETWLYLRNCDDAQEKQRLTQNLLEYCRLDTRGMVRILEKMKELTV